MPEAAVAARAKAEQAGRIDRLLTDARARLAQAEVAHEAASFDAVIAEDPREADQHLAAAKQELDQARDKVTALTVALGLATKAAAHAEALADAQRKADQVAAFEHRLSERDAAVAIFAEALGETIVKFHTVLDLTKDALAARGGSPVAGSLLYPAPLLRAIQADIYMRSAAPPLYGNISEVTRPSFPGAHCPDPRLAGTPSAIPSLVEAIAAGSAYELTCCERS